MKGDVTTLRDRARQVVRGFVGEKSASDLAKELSAKLKDSERAQFFEESLVALVNSEIGLAKIEDIDSTGDDLFPEGFCDAVISCGHKVFIHWGEAKLHHVLANREQRILNVRRTTRAFDRNERRVEQLRKVMELNPDMTVSEAIALLKKKPH